MSTREEQNDEDEIPYTINSGKALRALNDGAIVPVRPLGPLTQHIINPHTKQIMDDFWGKIDFFPVQPADKSTIKDPDIDERGNFQGKHKRSQTSQIECDSGYDYGHEEYFAYIKRPIVVNGQEIK